jgi:glutamine amidotransferase
MCRLYGFLANEPTKVECTLVHAQNALLHQSRADLRGRAHPDGWGISCYANGTPELERRAVAAHEDISFSAAAERVYSHAVIAHIRKATVGEPQIANTHPYAHACWTFAHNGTLKAFDRLEARLRDETAPRLRPLRRGTTDSEAVFYWLLTRMADAGIPLDAPCEDVDVLVDVLAAAVPRLASRSAKAGAEGPARLNFLLTDGRVLLASRWRNSLYRVERQDVHDCEICGIPHVHHQRGVRYRAVLVASEPISNEHWQEVPDRSLVVADAQLRLRILKLKESGVFHTAS